MSEQNKECFLIQVTWEDHGPRAASAIAARGFSAFDIGRMLGIAAISIEKQLTSTADSMKQTGASPHEIEQLVAGFQDARSKCERVAEQGSVHRRRAES